MTLKALNDKATPGIWKVAGNQKDLVYTADNVPVARIVNTQVFMRGGKTAGAWAPNADFIVALVNAYRAGELVPRHLGADNWLPRNKSNESHSRKDDAKTD